MQVERRVQTVAACAATPPSAEVQTGALRITLASPPEKSALCFFLFSFSLFYASSLHCVQSDPHYSSQEEDKQDAAERMDESLFIFPLWGEVEGKERPKNKRGNEWTDKRIAGATERESPADS